MSFELNNLQNDSPTENDIIIYWLGGAGFVFKFHDGSTICIDPYLSDAAERLFGFKRLSKAPIKADQLHFDVLLLTHEHVDHLDIDSFKDLTKANPDCRMLASESCVQYLGHENISYESVSPGISYTFGCTKIKAVPADHGDLCPDAVGFLISFEERVLYFTGDTAYNENFMAEAIEQKPEIVIPCMNGAYGNMNERQAALLVKKCNAKVAIPSHFGLFDEHGGDADRFAECVESESPNTIVHILNPGQGIEV